jgi:hypothetical protein
MSGIGENLIGEVLAQFATEMPFALAMLDLDVPEDAADRQRQRVVGVCDDHSGRPVKHAEERLPGGLILMRKRLQTPHPPDRRPLARLAFLAPDRSQDVKASPGVRAGSDPEVLTINRQRVRPTLGQLTGTHQLRAHVNPVGHQLPLVRGRPTPTPTRRRHPARLLARDLRRRPITRPLSLDAPIGG